MTASLTTTLVLETEPPVAGNPIWVRLTMTNSSDQKIALLNPDLGSPPRELEWPASAAAYRVALLMSFGLLDIKLEDSLGNPARSTGLTPWVTPIVGERVLQPHETLTIDFDLSELFSTDSAGAYRLYVKYGDRATDAEATMDLEILEADS
jgi:hypothetical protein